MNWVHQDKSLTAPALQRPGRCLAQASAAQRGRQTQWHQSPSPHQSPPAQDLHPPACAPMLAPSCGMLPLVQCIGWYCSWACRSSALGIYGMSLSSRYDLLCHISAPSEMLGWQRWAPGTSRCDRCRRTLAGYAHSSMYQGPSQGPGCRDLGPLRRHGDTCSPLGKGNEDERDDGTKSLKYIIVSRHTACTLLCCIISTGRAVHTNLHSVRTGGHSNPETRLPTGPHKLD